MVELQMAGRGDSEAHRSLRKWYQSLQKILGEAQLYSLLVFSFKRAQEELKVNRYIFFLLIVCHACSGIDDVSITGSQAKHSATVD